MSPKSNKAQERKLLKAQAIRESVLRDAIQEARADGMTLEDVGRVLGISRQAVHYYVKQGPCPDCTRRAGEPHRPGCPRGAAIQGFTNEGKAK